MPPRKKSTTSANGSGSSAIRSTPSKARSAWSSAWSGMGDVTACLESLEATPGVENAVRISAPYKFVSKEFKKEHTAMRINGVEIGGDEFVVMAGPCSVESRKADHGDGGRCRRGRRQASCAAAPSSRALRPTISRAWKKKASSCCARPRKPPDWASSPK